MLIRRHQLLTLKIDFSFNGKEDPTTNTTTWTETTHTYGTVKTPVVTGYYADKAVAGGKTVTPDAPNCNRHSDIQSLW